MAQSAAKRPLIAVLLATSLAAAARYVSHFPQGLKELSYVEGQNIDILYRYAEGDLTRLPTLADELVRLNPDVIVTAGSAVAAIKRSTATIPIVGVALTDPEGFGFVISIAHPGGQVTGIIYTVDSLPGKQLQLALEVLPGASKIGLLLNVSNPYASLYRRNYDAAAASWLTIVARVPLVGETTLPSVTEVLLILPSIGA
jgi:putative ABC transport system substrate-binding protein